MPAGIWLCLQIRTKNMYVPFVLLELLNSSIWDDTEVGLEHLVSDTETGLRRGIKYEMRCLTLKPRSQAFTIVPLHVCFPLEWKGGHGGSQAALRQGMWRKRCDPSGGGGQNRLSKTALWKTKRQPRINSTFYWIISSFGIANPLSSLLLFSLLSVSRRTLTAFLSNYIKLLKLLEAWKDIFCRCCVSFPSSCSHLHLIKTSEKTLRSLGARTDL